MMRIPDLCRFPSSGRDCLSIAFVYRGLFILALAWLIPGELAGQTAEQDAQSTDSLTLTFEREVFSYPQYSRRNPFRSLLGGDEGPRFDALVLVGILYSPFAGESIAILGEGSRRLLASAPGVPESYELLLTGAIYRVREGEIVGNGNVTVLTIELNQVTVDVAEFGLSETTTMELPRATSGGGPQ